MTPRDIHTLDFGCPDCEEHHEPEANGTRRCPQSSTVFTQEEYERLQAKEAVFHAVYRQVLHGTSLARAMVIWAWNRHVGTQKQGFEEKALQRWQRAVAHREQKVQREIPVLLCNACGVRADDSTVGTDCPNDRSLGGHYWKKQ